MILEQYIQPKSQKLSENIENIFYGKEKMKKLLTACFGLTLLLSLEVTAEALPEVVVVTTGGTIAEKIDPETGEAVPAVSGKDLIAAVPQLKKLAKIKVVSICNIESSHMTPEIWTELSRNVDKIIADNSVKAVVITHGTDTMAESAFFLELTLKSRKPVIFTGAMRNASETGPDGPANLYNAVLQAVSSTGKEWGVTVSLNNYINAAWSVRKTSTFNPQTFDSGINGYLGYACNGRIVKLNNVLYREKIPLPKDNRLPPVALFYAYAGDKGESIRNSIKHGAKGIVVVAVGAGNVNPDVADALLDAMKQGVTVVISTDVFTGPVAPVYGVKGAAAYMQKRGAILSGTVPPRKARLLLMLALAAGKNKEEISGLFKPDMQKK